MRDTQLYAAILGIRSPWQVAAVALGLEAGEVVVHLTRQEDVALECPSCGQPSPGYDHRLRRWRHLDTCQYQTLIEAPVPRVQCATHGVQQIAVPWALAGSRFTALFESLVLDWLQESSIAGVSRLMGLSWDQVDAIMQRAVERGLARRQPALPKRLGVDETSFQKRHEYVTVVTDLSGSDTVLHVASGRGQEALEGFLRGFSPQQRAQVEVVAMDMWEPYIAAVKAQIPGAPRKIAFDKFHVAAHLGQAVDSVRKAEHRALLARGDESLTGSQYLWLRNPERMSERRWLKFEHLRTSTLRTARAWSLKEAAMTLWCYTRRGWATRAWRQWISWARRCRLEPVKRVASMVKRHLEGIVTAIVHQVTNARAEAMNAKIQRLKHRACGYRNPERFRRAIYFYHGGLDLSVHGAPTHTKA